MEETINFSELSIEELREKLATANAARDNISKVAKSITKHIDMKLAAEKIAAMPEAEKAALLQTLQAQGVSSGEEFGKV
jgi:hypothetical protein